MHFTNKYDHHTFCISFDHKIRVFSYYDLYCSRLQSKLTEHVTEMYLFVNIYNRENITYETQKIRSIHKILTLEILRFNSKLAIDFM